MWKRREAKRKGKLRVREEEEGRGRERKENKYPIHFLLQFSFDYSFGTEKFSSSSSEEPSHRSDTISYPRRMESKKRRRRRRRRNFPLLRYFFEVLPILVICILVHFENCRSNVRFVRGSSSDFGNGEIRRESYETQSKRLGRKSNERRERKVKQEEENRR